MERIRFPYMFWAHEQCARTPHVLTQSGMPNADPALFAGLPGIDLGHPSESALPQVEERLARKFGVDPSRVIVTLGASGGMFLAAARWFRRGSRVVVDRPSYEPFRALPPHFGAECVALDRRLETGWSLDPAEVRAALAGAKGPGHVFFANLHNPTGARAKAGDLREMASAAAEHGGRLVVCEVYMEYAPAEERLHAFQLAPNGVSIGSLTKAYGLGPLRAGWMVLGEEVAAERRELIDHLYLDYVDPPTIALRAFASALDQLEVLARPIARVAEQSRPVWERWLRETEGIQAHVPKRGIIAFPRVEGVSDTAALCEYLVAQHQVDVVPGEYFGLAGHIRVGCALPPELLKAGLERLEAGIRAFRASAAPAAKLGR
ncbi:MAG: pyridoxal phosphate-dependent aminotransferase [Planctomycetes bacterium]|nr:pyridoxal phosphate-dependent aminotransferase [Planctomycetota bacterium]